MIRNLILPALACAPLSAQLAPPSPQTQAQKAVVRGVAATSIHPYLATQLEKAEADDRIPAYFVMADNLPQSHFYPRVLRMDKEKRRETVMRELSAHMERTQGDLMTFLEREVAAGRLKIVSRNWLGNFVRVIGTPQALRGAAAIAGVGEAWYDYVPPIEEVEDGDGAASAALPAAPGNGPLDTRADQVWAAGFKGKGVVWMNSDSGVRAGHSTVADVHPGLKGKLWTNPGEIINNGIDDDNNGKVDDYFGWNFGSNSKSIDDSGGHGTSCAGVFVGVEHTNGDELGNCPDARIMTGRLSGESSQWDAVQYAIVEGAHGQTSSHSYKNNYSTPPNYKMHRQVGDNSMAAGLIRTNSTSNNGSSAYSATSQNRVPFNISAPGNLPSPWIHPSQTLVGGTSGVLGIGAHNVGTAGPSQPSYSPHGPFAWNLPDLLIVRPTYPVANWSAQNNDYPWTGGSQQGLIKPDLTAPTGTRTTRSSSGYGSFSGTSNATPSASSCLALALSANMSLTPEDMAMAVQTTAVDYGAAGKDNDSGAGKIDAWELTKMCRAIHRVDGDVSHTVRVSTSQLTQSSLDLDASPLTGFLLLLGTGPASQVFGEITLRVSNPALILGNVTDASGNFKLTVPVFPALAGIDVYSQFIVLDAAFGGAIGSNAVRIRFVQ